MGSTVERSKGVHSRERERSFKEHYFRLFPVDRRCKTGKQTLPRYTWFSRLHCTVHTCSHQQCDSKKQKSKISTKKCSRFDDFVMIRSTGDIPGELPCMPVWLDYTKIPVAALHGLHASIKTGTSNFSSTFYLR